MCGDSSLKRKDPDLGDVRNPTALVKLMHDKEYRVVVNEITMPKGKVVEVRVPEREVSLIFVTPEVCQQSGREWGPGSDSSCLLKKCRSS